MIGITLVRGLPGSGKSTYAKSLGMKWYEADMYHCDKFGIYKFNPEKAAEAHAWSLHMAVTEIRKGLPVVISNTFTRLVEMQPYFFHAKELNVPVTVVEMNGDYGNVHQVPQHTLDNMRNRWEWFPEGTFFLTKWGYR